MRRGGGISSFPMETIKPNHAAASFHAVILAGGRGTRMQTDLPKLLHPIAGRPILRWVIAAARDAGAASVTVVLPADEPRLHQLCHDVQTVVQPTPLGTGDALRCAMPLLPTDTLPVAVIYGDTPFLQPATLQAMTQQIAQDNTAIVLLATRAAEPNGYSRMVLNPQNQVLRLVEQVEATAQERALPLSFAGMMAVARHGLADALGQIDNHNAKQEYYLTQLVALANAAGQTVGWSEVVEAEIMGINTQAELAAAESLAQDRLRAQFLSAGVRMPAPSTVFFSADSVIGRGTVIEPNVVIGNGVVIGENCQIRAFSYLEQSTLANAVEVGPFARVGPDAVLEPDVMIGNFVEVKRAHLSSGVKAKHLSYLGNVTIGANSNIGAGTVVCNYNGFQKSPTVIGASAFIGSNSVLVAPITIGDGAYIAAGSTITESVPDNALGIGRALQTTKSDGGTRLRQKYSKKTK